MNILFATERSHDADRAGDWEGCSYPSLKLQGSPPLFAIIDESAVGRLLVLSCKEGGGGQERCHWRVLLWLGTLGFMSGFRASSDFTGRRPHLASADNSDGQPAFTRDAALSPMRRAMCASFTTRQGRGVVCRKNGSRARRAAELSRVVSRAPVPSAPGALLAWGRYRRGSRVGGRGRGVLRSGGPRWRDVAQARVGVCG